MNSLPIPSPDCTEEKLNSRCMPQNQARNDTHMNSPIFTFGTGTPTARAESALPPTAKIQLPTLVRSRTQEPIATNSSHQMTVMLTVMNPRLTLPANTALAAGNPSRPETLAVATVPVVALVTPRLMPRSMKNVDSVIRNEGILVLTTR